ncbi:class I SAM-dependent methyltransferase [Candidatus Dojkabacteria bacterium]|jgi:hypothetical protein|nr:class I SAM-dependent methyltransferase [Candidatus Dojkabacteria bacterium]
MVRYNLQHLTQDDAQNKPGAIQDDEALLFFALIRVTRIKRILEFGGVPGYSAKNFCEALNGDGMVYTTDWGVDGETPKQGANHKVIVKNAADVTPGDLDNEPVDLVFFDCHAYEAELCVFQNLKRAGIITDKTIFAFHDTNLLAHELSLGYPNISYEVKDGWVFCPPERQLVNDFKAMGYDIINLHTNAEVHNEKFPYRCGLSIARKFIPLELKYGATAPWMKPQDIESEQFIKVGDFDYKRK